MNESTNQSGRNPIVMIVGLVVLTAAAALVIIGPRLGAGEEAISETEGSGVVLESIPADDVVEVDLANVPNAIFGEAVGLPAPNFTASDLDGNLISLADFRGQPVMLNFWATWCGPCRHEMPELQEAFEKYEEEGLVILALHQGEPSEDVGAFFYDEFGLTFTPLMDVDRLVSGKYQASSFTPSSFFVDPDGIITATHPGILTLPQIDDIVQRMLDGG